MRDIQEGALKLGARQKAAVIEDSIRQLRAEIEGRKVRIMSDYNGQPFGRSRISLKGMVFEIQRAHWNGGWYLQLKDLIGFCFIKLEDVEFDDGQTN